MVADKTVWQAFEEERPKLIPVPQSATAQSRYAAGLPGRDLETGP